MTVVRANLKNSMVFLKLLTLFLNSQKRNFYLKWEKRPRYLFVSQRFRGVGGQLICLAMCVALL